jgi:hypothetical protein
MDEVFNPEKPVLVGESGFPNPMNPISLKDRRRL